MTLGDMIERAESFEHCGRLSRPGLREDIYTDHPPSLPYHRHAEISSEACDITGDISFASYFDEVREDIIDTLIAKNRKSVGPYFPVSLEELGSFFGSLREEISEIGWILADEFLVVIDRT